MYHPFHTPLSFQAQNHHKASQLKIDWLVGLGFTHGLTLQWNFSVPYSQAYSDIQKLHARVDRRLLGPRYHRSSDRTLAVFFFEGEERVNLHVHSLWRVPEEKVATFEALFAKPFSNTPCLWKTLVPKGCQMLIPTSNPHAAAAYMTKEQHLGTEGSREVWSHDLISSDAGITLTA